MPARPDRWVLFDLDGTLFDYDAAETAAVSATLRAASLDPTPAVLSDYRRANAEQWAALERGETNPARLRIERWERVLRRHGIDGVDTAALSEHYIGQLAAGSQLMAGAEQVVAEVARDHRVAFITNGLADVQRPRLAGSGLQEAAEVIVISDEVGAAKPDAAIFEAAFRQMGQPTRDAVTMVGDSLSADIAGGAAFGLATVWLAPAGTPDPGPDAVRPTHRIADLRELPAVLAPRA